MKNLATGEISVTFHVVTFGTIDVVHAWKNFEQKVEEHEPGTSVEIAGTQFVPKHQSLRAEFSSDPYFEEDGKGTATFSENLVNELVKS